MIKRVCCVLAYICVWFCIGTNHVFANEVIPLSGKKIEELLADYVRPTAIPENPHNSFSEAKRVLGHKLFFDPRLSKSGIMSCATCHNPGLGWEDGLPKAIGHKGDGLNRHTPTILNLAWAPYFFWDGRVTNLEDQAKMPMLNMTEMGMTEDGILVRIKAIEGYKSLFEAAFPGEKITLDTVSKAIAIYERSIVSGDSRFDLWVKGDQTALNDSEKRGFVLFNEKAKCAVCHIGWRFTDDGFHDIGLKTEDLGRGLVIKNVLSMKHAFKTPTLRNIASRSPFMHNGSLQTLEDVIRHYENGFEKRESLSWAMQPFSLTDNERSDLIAFLKTLSSHERTEVPELPY